MKNHRHTLCKIEMTDYKKRVQNITTKKRVKNTMLKLKNVKKDDNYISAEYWPEDWDEFGMVKVNIYDLDDYEVKLSPKDEKEYSALPYAINALNALRDMAEGKREIKDCTIMWY